MADYTDEKGKRLKRRFDAAKSLFASRASTLDVLAPLFDPSRGKTQSNISFEGSSWMTTVYDGTGIHASEMAALFFDGYSTNPATKWFRYKDANPLLNLEDEVNEWYDECSDRASEAMRAANIYACFHENHKDWWNWGDASLIVEERRNIPGRSVRGFRGLRCTVDRVGRFYLELDSNNEPGAEFREFQLNAWAAMERYKGHVSEKITQAHQQQNYDQKFSFVHAVYPRTSAEQMAGRGYRNRLPYASCDFELDTGFINSEDGYESYPFANPRQSGLFGETYGRGRADLAANDMMTVNAAKQLGLEDHALKIRPPTFVDDDTLSGAVILIPGSFIPIGRRGNMPIQDRFLQYQTGARPDITNIKEEDIRQAVERHYHVDAFKQALEQDLQRVNNFTYGKQIELTMKMVGPHYTSLQFGLHEPTALRVFRIMYNAGAFSSPPDAILQFGGQVSVAFESPLSKAQRQDEAVAMERWNAWLSARAQAQAQLPESEIFDIVSPDVDRNYGDILGVTAANMRSKKEMITLQKSRAEAQQAQQMQAEAMGVTEGLKNISPYLKAVGGQQ
jgi:hypothetical protein